MTVTLAATFILTILPDRNPLMMPLLFVAVMVLAILAFWNAWRRFSDK